VYPGILILTTVVAINVLGDALRDAAEPEPRG
jgi:ABC-type dipeptide/oligopeptide/nickel transport system permease subunit